MADTTGQTTSYPNLDPNGGTSIGGLQGSGIQNGSTQSANAGSFKDSIVNNAQSARDTIANHPITQNITQGPMADKARTEADKTSNEFSNVVNSRKVPDQPAATGQPLTHYHSLFYNILSWENPRITAISYAAIVSLIFFTRYVPVLKYALKGTYIVLGIIAAAETAGKLIFDRGLASQMRPRKYYTLPRETLEASLEDAEQLVNFFIIEFQRIIFAENVYATIAAFTAALFAYVLVKFAPTWGVLLIFTTVTYFAPLLYIQNKEFIDHHLNNAGTIVNDQTSQFRDLAAQHTSRAGEVAKSTVSQYSAKAQELIGQTKSKAAEPNAPNPANLNPVKEEPERNITRDDLPSVPTSAPNTSTQNTSGLNSFGNNEPIHASQTEHAQPAQGLPAFNAE